MPTMARGHAMVRAAQRFGLQLTESDVAEFHKKIKRKEYFETFPAFGKDFKGYVLRWNQADTLIGIVYNIHQKEIVTLLTMQQVAERRKEAAKWSYINSGNFC